MIWVLFFFVGVFLCFSLCSLFIMRLESYFGIQSVKKPQSKCVNKKKTNTQTQMG